MARPSVPKRTLSSNIKIRRTFKDPNITSYSGMTLVRLGWDSLNLENIVDVFEHKSKGIPFSSLVFAGIEKPFSGAW